MAIFSAHHDACDDGYPEVHLEGTVEEVLIATLDCGVPIYRLRVPAPEGKPDWVSLEEWFQTGDFDLLKLQNAGVAAGWAPLDFAAFHVKFWSPAQGRVVLFSVGKGVREHTGELVLRRGWGDWNLLRGVADEVCSGCDGFGAVPCDDCGGAGEDDDGEPCDWCEGDSECDGRGVV